MAQKLTAAAVIILLVFGLVLYLQGQSAQRDARVERLGCVASGHTSRDCSGR
jgi:hypothetical protein